MYANIEPLCCTPETNIMICQLYLNQKKKIFCTTSKKLADSQLTGFWRIFGGGSKEEVRFREKGFIQDPFGLCNKVGTGLQFLCIPDQWKVHNEHIIHGISQRKIKDLTKGGGKWLVLWVRVSGTWPQ